MFQRKYKRDIPADGFPQYAHDIWQTILSNTDLNVPSQKELLAKTRCDDIASAALAYADDAAKSLDDLVGLPDSGQLKRAFETIRREVVERYDKQAARYNKDIYEQKRVQLLHHLYRILMGYYEKELTEIIKASTLSFQATFKVPLVRPLS